MAGDLVVTRSCRVPLSELSWSFTGPGGPGGQHANTSNTKVILTFDIAASPSLGPRQRARLIERLGNQTRVVVSTERSQHRNRATALALMSGRLAAALAVPRPRLHPAPPASAERRRLEGKARQSEKKRARRPPAAEE